ncbi:MAG: hypothetical protein ACOC5U_04765, partial [Candidatus Aminicenantaceae bacterium]
RNMLGWNEDIASPIKIQNAYKWNHHMDKNKILIINHACKDLAKTYGYDVSSQKIPFLLKMGVSVGKLAAWTTIKMEKGCFQLPFPIQVRIVNKLDPLV